MVGADARTWELRVASVRGARHVKSGAPNEDAADCYRSADGESAVICVADGHGSRHSFRADIGASLAVEAGLSGLRDFLESQSSASLAQIRQDAAKLPERILGAWTRHVRQHVADHPIGADELERAGISGELSDGRLMVAYGATLLAVGVTPAFSILTQLGDGDIVWREDGRVRRPLGGSTEPHGDETVSLASGPLALAEWRVLVEDWVSRPELIMLSTDGYANSFASDDGFLAVADDLHTQIVRDGLDRVSDQLPTWLRTTSREGSGDDITVGLLLSLDSGDLLQTVRPKTDRKIVVAAKTGGAGAHVEHEPARRWQLAARLGIAGGGALLFMAGAFLGWAAGSGFFTSDPNANPSPAEVVESSPASPVLGPPVSP